MSMSSKFWLPTRPFDLASAVNRSALATGSLRAARAGAQADYNGHAVYVCYNTYRRYFVTEYTWVGRVVLARGDFRACALAAKREYDRGALGAVVRLTAETPEQAEQARALGYRPWSVDIEAAHNATWWTELHGLVNDALALERRVGIPAVAFLTRAASRADYEAKIRTFRVGAA